MNLSRSTVLTLLGRISVGHIYITDTDGKVTICGGAGVKDGSSRTEMKVLKEAFWVRVLLFADMVREMHRMNLGTRAKRMLCRDSQRVTC